MAVGYRVSQPRDFHFVLQIEWFSGKAFDEYQVRRMSP